ncbi:vanadium-dependent haloperoxidase [Massilia eburnea]|nr:vanadium-dependent haloperoxidase [Massilia eburnea]
MSLLSLASRCARFSSNVALALLAACGGGSGGDSAIVAANVPIQPVALAANHTNAVSYWHDVAVATVNASGAAAATPEEQRTIFNVDMATVSLAMYDASAAIDGRYKLFGPAQSATSSGASIDAAVGAAAYSVLQALFPNRSDQYSNAYVGFLAGLPTGDARDKGIALGTQVARNIVALRADDGRSVALAPYMPGTDPGKYRGSNPVDRFRPSIRPFVLSSNDQFRPPPPPAIASTAYATDFNEVRAYGGIVSIGRTPEQLEMARFHTEPPPFFLTRNFGWFARTTANTADAARLLALIYVASADAIDACFEAKYFYERWRPQSAINLADTDGNDMTDAVPDWAPALPTPPHPEYPAAHGCTAGSLAEVLRQYYGTRSVGFAWDSKATNTTRTYATTDAFIEEVTSARIMGGMHFRTSLAAGTELGAKTSAYILQNKFGPR